MPSPARALVAQSTEDAVRITAHTAQPMASVRDRLVMPRRQQHMPSRMRRSRAGRSTSATLPKSAAVTQAPCPGPARAASASRIALGHGAAPTSRIRRNRSARSFRSAALGTRYSRLEDGPETLAAAVGEPTSAAVTLVATPTRAASGSALRTKTSWTTHSQAGLLEPFQSNARAPLHAAHEHTDRPEPRRLRSCRSREETA